MAVWVTKDRDGYAIFSKKPRWIKTDEIWDCESFVLGSWDAPEIEKIMPASLDGFDDYEDAVVKLGDWRLKEVESKEE